MLDGSELASLRSDPEPFRAELDRDPSSEIAVFENLGGDALLLAPRRVGPLDAYGHLAAFVRRAPAPQVRELWQRTASVVRERLGEDPIWLSTAGLGVAWVHIRLDSRPKYYRHAPYSIRMSSGSGLTPTFQVTGRMCDGERRRPCSG